MAKLTAPAADSSASSALIPVLPTSLGNHLGNPFFDLFPHRFDYICAPYPEPHTSPHWQTESRHPLTDRLLQQSSYLYGVRFGAKTRYCLLDVDIGSAYHPQIDPLAISRMVAALEPIGLVSYLACTSSDSGGLHLYFPFATAQSSWELGTAVSALLENHGFKVKPGQLEVFPNRKSYSVQGKPSLFNAHRLPLQIGSYLLNRCFEPVWSDQQSFIHQWQRVETRNEVTTKTLRQVLKQSQRQHYRVSGKAAKFINDLNAEIDLGWTGSGQTNYLLGRITMRAYIFHHILEGDAPLVGSALVKQIVETARALPGYQEWCQHQHELEHRAEEWARCIENSKYFHYGFTEKQTKQTKQTLQPELVSPTLTWNQQQCENVRARIQSAIVDLLNQNILPALATARFKALTQYRISGSSLYRHKDLWHPEFLALNLEHENLEERENLNQADLTQPVERSVNTAVDNSNYELSYSYESTIKAIDLDSTDLQLAGLQVSHNLTSLFPSLGRNPFYSPDSSSYTFDKSELTGRNLFTNLGLRKLCPFDRAFMPDLGASFFTKDQIGCTGQQHSGQKVVAGNGYFHIANTEPCKHDHGDHFLQHFELRQTKISSPNSVSRNLEAIFKQSNRPTDANRDPERSSSKIFKMTIPGKGHKDIGDQEQNDWFEHDLW
jgi:hypothetical protein